MPRELIYSPGHDRTRSLGWLALAWIEHFCIHGPGDVQGQLVVLDDELAEFTADCHALTRSGRREYDSVFFSRAKGRTKSEVAGFGVLFEAFGPCRFAGWAEGGEVYRWRDFEYRYEPGEPMGRPVTYPFVRCLATEEDQSGNTYDNVYYNLTEGPLSEGLSATAAGLTRTILPHGGEIRPSTASNAAKDGGKETHCVFDETHLYTLPELRRMYNTVRRNMDKRKDAEPWALETSTMYAPGEDSTAEETHRFAKAIREGRAKASRLLFDHRQAPPDVNLEDEDELRAALVEAYGPFAGVMDLDRIINSIWDPRNPPSDSRRYFLNQPTAAEDAWLAEYEWAGRTTAETVVADRDMITLGFDGSRKRSKGVTDATALIGCRVNDGHVFELGVWEQPDGPAGQDWHVPVSQVNAAVAQAFDRYTVVGFYADPALWEEQVASWEATYGSRLKVKAMQAHPCQWWMGGRSLKAVRATERLHNAVVDGEMTHDGSYALTRHVLNARRRESTQGIRIYKEHPDSPRKIDAAIAAILAFEARGDAVAAGVLNQRAVSSRLYRY